MKQEEHVQTVFDMILEELKQHGLSWKDVETVISTVDNATVSKENFEYHAKKTYKVEHTRPFYHTEDLALLDFQFVGSDWWLTTNIRFEDKIHLHNPFVGWQFHKKPVKPTKEIKICRL